ncbi:aminotransferase class V-fold PLP-dependent enzyme [Pandoraea pulmonicola]|uniref:Cysteine desulfurase n=1 Tax=Pandoraea pulmonicola TaxID=93221 RepID=A0AAJ4ZEF4_PANPU|nr:cysteine desulfurase [Pandoraea pulmonicola]AJC19862.1 cysteine sulfinate desulfinase [Pandoraea pulmonicola]SUA91949.1 Cysteine desulfurase [Pandoraea pulmonicola]
MKDRRPVAAVSSLDGAALDFPLLSHMPDGQRLAYLDNAATTQKPWIVLEAERDFYLRANANVYRGVHRLSENATRLYDAARQRVANWLNAGHEEEIVFVRGATEGINLVAQSYAAHVLAPGDEILITELEHHSNIVPWQRVCAERKASLKAVPVSSDGQLDVAAYPGLLGPRVKLFAVTQVSNVLGSMPPIEAMISVAHARGIPVLVDGAQATGHLKVDVQSLDCDFYVFSAHKMYGPTGIGVLYGKRKYLDAMPVWQAGGGMIHSVSLANTEYAALPYRFEAGTPHIAGAIGLHAAIDYLERRGLAAIQAHEHRLLTYAVAALRDVPGLTLLVPSGPCSGIVSFNLEGLHPHDVATVLDAFGVAIRAGHHCAMPLMQCLGQDATVRLSFGLYNTQQDVDQLVAGLRRARQIIEGE